MPVPKGPGRLDTVHPRHGHVHQDDVGMLLSGLDQGVGAITRLTHDGQAGQRQRNANSFSQRGTVIHNQYPQRVGVGARGWHRDPLRSLGQALQRSPLLPVSSFTPSADASADANMQMPSASSTRSVQDKAGAAQSGAKGAATAGRGGSVARGKPLAAGRISAPPM